MLRLISDQFIDIHDFNFARDNPSFKVIESLIANKELAVCEEVDPRDPSSNKLSQRLKKLQRVEQFIFEERGAKDLYVGWPYITGKFSNDTLVRCPLIFFPVEIYTESGNWFLGRRKDVNVTLNKSFLLAYAYYNDVSLDEELVETILTDFNHDATIFRTQLYELLKDSNVEIDFNKENFRDELKPFKNFRKAQFEKEQHTGKLKLCPEAVMGIYPQAGSYLVPDYTYLIKSNTFDDLEEFFAQRIKDDPEDEGRTKFSDRVIEENTYTPFELDAYQESALKKIKKGNSITVQGPPGTGKSQLISNLICDYTARGKNVLLVCQKRVALDVVYDRLKEKELHDFIGLVHDFKNDRRDIFEKIDTQVNRIHEYQQKNNSLDTIQLERTFTQASRKIEQIAEELEEYKFALFDESECGKSVKELYLISDPNAKFVHLKQVYNTFPFAEIDVFRRKLERYLNYFKEYESQPHFWAHELSFSNFSTEDFVRIKEVLSDTTSTFDRFRKDSSELLHKELDYDATRFFLQKRALLDQFITNLDNEEIYWSFKNLLQHKPDEEGKWIVELEQAVLNSFKGAGIETSLKPEELGRMQESLQRAIKARKNPFNWLRWRLFSKDRIFITRVLVSNDLKGNGEGFRVLVEKIDNRLNYEHNLSIIEGKNWLTNFPERTRKMDVQNWFFYQRNAFKTYQHFLELRNIDAFVSFKSDDRKNQVDKLRQFVQLLDRFPEHYERWNKYLTEHQIRELLSGRVKIQEAAKQLDQDFENLHDYHKIKSELLSNEKLVVRLIEEVEGDTNEKLECFDNSLALAWIDHIESKYPVLRTISSLKFEQNIKELRQAIQDKRKTSNDILLLKSRERTYQGLEYNRLNNLVTYRDLQHQVRKKKKIWPLRRVISEFKDELFKLIPCWMASPESASAIFPMEEVFDLVIFDEASQCFAERGIPSMYRGKQIVIAGDSKQLKPFDLYRVRWEEDNEEDIPELEIDSLLDLTSRFLPSAALKGHYRSRSLPLIDFSSKHFYDGTLQFIPDLTRMNHPDPPIDYIRVDGTWENNINKTESEAVVELIEKLWKEQPDKNIGVVTFNGPQQSYILDLLDEKIKDWRQLPPNLFVKNIENVQGDERDFIIFTTAYARDNQGRLQFRFGSLNNAGGENRLNVAVTRAKEHIFLVTSLFPGEMKVEGSKNEGPKLLKKYLEYAYSVSEKSWKPHLLPPAHEHADWYLKNKLISDTGDDTKGPNLADDMPFADLVIRKNGQARGLILTDDDQYYNSHSIKDIYVYQPEILSEKKWPYLRINSRDRWMNPEQVGDRIRIFLNRLVQSPS